ncbi:hypothetical protein LJB93_01980 [Desulfovibrio sp. OttesenSCG-928-F07]|nr:hypothetical protein [Desulfovibrio sp. OttesenSCG-928-F07]
MKKLILPLLIFTFSSSPAALASTIICANCSTVVQQILDSITFANQLTTTIQQYEELAQQTIDSAFMVASEVDRLKNLPETKLNKWRGTFERLAENLANMQQQGYDSSAIIDVFRAAYPDFDALYGLTKDELDNPNAMQTRWVKRQQITDKEIENAVGISGLTMRMAKDPVRAEQFERDLEEWLKTANETEIQQAANQINGAILRDMNEMKSLMAATLQLQATMAADKQNQEREERLNNKRFLESTGENFRYSGTARY